MILVGIGLLFCVGTGSIILSCLYDKPTIIIPQKIHPMHVKSVKSDDLEVLLKDWTSDDEPASVNF